MTIVAASSIISHFSSHLPIHVKHLLDEFLVLLEDLHQQRHRILRVHIDIPHLVIVSLSSACLAEATFSSIEECAELLQPKDLDICAFFSSLLSFHQGHCKVFDANPCASATDQLQFFRCFLSQGPTLPPSLCIPPGISSLSSHLPAIHSHGPLSTTKAHVLFLSILCSDHPRDSLLPPPVSWTWLVVNLI